MIQTQLLQVQKVELIELQKLLRSRGANVITTVYMSWPELKRMCNPKVEKRRFKLSFEKQAVELDREIGLQPVIALAIRVDDRIICIPTPADFPENVYFLTVVVDAKGETPEARERYARDLIEAASAVTGFKLPEAEIKEKLPYAWKELYGLDKETPDSGAGGEPKSSAEHEGGGEGQGGSAEGDSADRGGEKAEADQKEDDTKEPEPPAPEDQEMLKIVDELLRKAKIEPGAVEPKIKGIMAQMVADPVATVARYFDIPISKLQDKEALSKIAECIKSPTPPPVPPTQQCKCEQRKVEPSEFIAQWLGISEKLATKLAMWLEGLTKEELEALLKKVGYG